MKFLRLCLLSWAALLVQCLAFSASAASILVVESYNAEYAWDASYKQALDEMLGKNHTLEYFQMDTKRLPKEQHTTKANEAWDRYEKLRPDLVILGDDAALKFLAQRLSTTTTPVVYLGINNSPVLYPGATARNFTGVLERPFLKRNVAIAHELLPKARRALIMFDNDTTAHVIRKDAFGDQDVANINGVNVDLTLFLDWEQWKKAVLDARKNNYDMLFVGLYHTLRDRSGKAVNPEDVVRWTSDNAPVPTFGFWDFSVGAGKTAGGLVLLGKEQGKAAAEMALKILAGTRPADITPQMSERGRLLFSKKQLGRFQLTLPKTIAQEAEYID